MHATRVCKSANYYLHCIRKICNRLSLDICKFLVHTLVTVRLDYGNALLCGARDGVIKQLERVQRQSARVVCKKIQYDRHTSVTELLCNNGYTTKAFAVAGPRLWNTFDNELRGCKNVELFKKKMNTLLFRSFY